MITILAFAPGIRNSSHSPEWTHILRSRRKRTDKLEAFAGTRRADSAENINVLPKAHAQPYAWRLLFQEAGERSVGWCHAPQRRAGVFTGASQSAVRASSSSVTVTEQPAISSDVT